MAYYFDKYLFDDFIEKMEESMEIEYTYNLMLVLVEVNKSKGHRMVDLFSISKYNSSTIIDHHPIEKNFPPNQNILKIFYPPPITISKNLH